MPRLRNKDTDAVVSVSDDTAALMDARVWVSADKPADKSAPKAAPVKKAPARPVKK
jgi:hypothetical protein